MNSSKEGEFNSYDRRRHRRPFSVFRAEVSARRDSDETCSRMKPPHEVPTHRLLSSSFLGLPYRILNMNHKKELLRSLWVVPRPTWLRPSTSRGAPPSSCLAAPPR